MSGGPVIYPIVRQDTSIECPNNIISELKYNINKEEHEHGYFIFKGV